jgi:hypothetical protein
MSILGKFLRGPVDQPHARPEIPQPQLEALQRQVAELAVSVERARQLAIFQLDMQTSRELRELRADPRYGAPGRLERHGYKVWSQNDEDGILAEIFRRIGTARSGQPGSFIEFGVSDGRECNTLKLLVEGWQGLWLEMDPQQCERMRRIFAAPLAEGRLELKQTSVTAENIDALLASSRVAAAGEVDLLSIDIDGNDYHVLKAISLKPRVLVVEYNGKFPPPMDLVIPYDPAHRWDGSDYGGNSLQAIANLATRKGYRLVGTNITGVNSFFVRSDLAGNHFADEDVAALFNPARFWLSPGYVSSYPTGERFTYTSDAALKSK